MPGCGGLFTTSIVEIPWVYGKTYTLVPFGDVHYGAPLHCSSEWERFCNAQKGRKDVAFLGMGDMTDVVSTSERAVLKMGKGGLHESTMESIEDMYRKTTDDLLETISFMRGRCLGLIEGNHFGQFGDGTTTTQRMCQALRTKYLGCICIVRLCFVFSGTSKLTVDILAHHGKGGGQLAGTPFNQVGKMADIAEADIYLMGHDHNRGCVTGQRMYPYFDSRKKQLVMKERKIIYGRTGSFLRGYVPNKVSYIADMALKPANLGWIEIEITPHRLKDGKGGQETVVDIRGLA